MAKENVTSLDVAMRAGASQSERGYHTLVFMASQEAENIDKVLEEILDYQADGLMLASIAMSSSLAERCVNAGLLVVLFNRSQDDEILSSVTCDNITGGRKVAEFLVAGGHRIFGYIAGWEATSTQRDRENGFFDGLRKAGLRLFSREVGDHDFQKAKEAARRMFGRDDRPDVVFVANDHMAFAVMDVLRWELRNRVPEDVSVVGFDDVPLAAWASFDLTTVRQPSNRMVRETVATLTARIEEGATQPLRVTIDGPLMIRGTARLPEGVTRQERADEGV